MSDFKTLLELAGLFGGAIILFAQDEFVIFFVALMVLTFGLVRYFA